MCLFPMIRKYLCPNFFLVKVQFDHRCHNARSSLAVMPTDARVVVVARSKREISRGGMEINWKRVFDPGLDGHARDILDSFPPARVQSAHAFLRPALWRSSSAFQHVPDCTVWRCLPQTQGAFGGSSLFDTPTASRSGEESAGTKPQPERAGIQCARAAGAREQPRADEARAWRGPVPGPDQLRGQQPMAKGTQRHREVPDQLPDAPDAQEAVAETTRRPDAPDAQEAVAETTRTRLVCEALNRLRQRAFGCESGIMHDRKRSYTGANSVRCLSISTILTSQLMGEMAPQEWYVC